MSTSALSRVEGKSTRPSEQAIITEMETWLQMAYDYYALDANGHLSADHRETMGSVSRYLDTVNRQLKSRLGARPAAQVIATASVHVPAPVTPTDDECQVCLEVVGGRGYALLKACDHKYCEPCVRTLLSTNAGLFNGPGLECPTCRARSLQVIFNRGTFHSSGPQKEALFKSHVCLAHRRDEQRGTATRPLGAPAFTNIFRGTQ